MNIHPATAVVEREPAASKLAGVPLKLAIVAGQLGLGGAEQQLYYFLAGLGGTRVQPMVITLGARADEYWEKPIRALNVPVVHVPRASGRGARALKVASILRSARATIVHGWAFHVNPYAALGGRLAGVPVRLGSMRESYHGLPQGRMLRWLGLSGLDALVTNSAANVGLIRTLIGSDIAVSVVPNGIHLQREISDAERCRLKAELGFDASDTVIGTIGRADYNKNHSMLLRAFASLAGRWPKLRLVIIGDGPLMPDLNAYVSQYGLGAKVRLTGAIPMGARYLPVFDVCCLTSKFEGMSNLLMEASAAGVPVVATQCGSSVELIAHDLTGFLIESDDDAELAAAVDVLLSQPEKRRQMGEAGRAKMQHEFAMDAMVTRMMNVYEGVLASKGQAYRGLRS